MKKNIFMISVAMLALVSCTNDEVVQINKGQKIEFRTAVTTRATELTNTDLPSFWVTALYDNVEYFSDEFTKDNTDGCFKSTTDYYWPATEEVKFYAYYPYGEDLPGTVSINAEAKQVKDFTPDEDIANQVDFVTAFEVYTKDEATNGSVGLDFEHQLSQIEIKAKNTNSGYTTTVKAIRIKNVVASGDFNFSAAVTNWTPSEDLTSYEIGFDPLTLTSEEQSLMSNKGNAMLIPQSRLAWGVEEAEPEVVDEGSEGEGETPETPTAPETDPNGTYIAFLVQINTATGIRIFPEIIEGNEEDTDVEYAWVAKPLAINWLTGYKYTYVFDFKDGAGVIAPDNFGDDPILPGGGEDPKPGDDVYGGKISVSLSFKGWNNNNDSYQDVPANNE